MTLRRAAMTAVITAPLLLRGPALFAAEPTASRPLAAYAAPFDPHDLSLQTSAQLRPAFPRPARRGHVSSRAVRRAGWTIAGSVLGLFAGASLGAFFEPPCVCDDPGLTGALIGAPIGVAAGGVLGFMWGSR